MTIYKWIHKPGSGVRLYNVGTKEDGTLHNPRGYPDEMVRAAVEAADQRRSLRRSGAAKKAAETRRQRQEKRVYDVAKRIKEGHQYGPTYHCVVCLKGLSDPESIERGIGSDCWQGVLGLIGR